MSWLSGGTCGWRGKVEVAGGRGASRLRRRGGDGRRQPEELGTARKRGPFDFGCKDLIGKDLEV
jgi:hypothetical protein